MNNESLKLLSLYLKYHVTEQLDATEVYKNISRYLSASQIENWHLFFVCHTLLNVAHEQQKITTQQYQSLYQHTMQNCDGKWITRIYWPEELEKIASHLCQQKIWNSCHLQQCTNLLKTLPGSITQSNHHSTIIEQQQMFHHYYIEKELGRGGMGAYNCIKKSQIITKKDCKIYTGNVRYTYGLSIIIMLSEEKK